ncbi:related to swi/snf-related matrix-associated actin-dependent regulator of chromatin, subfamily c, member 1 [Melanopsichium pennsylvanicum]|uniref:Related to swi/snf-related matrix-associated actin-dependent regulator of chromatin, subfamily c, member 1 n=2 Tax=Melanopsichium pennsylvanicum TaxID=63383 RepID=A0AAJ4XMT8_9BASI|nr:related to swi/snf-related matrix-associated actin-dependent regulator of chromatin, subfamily c, member 1 [Melanopsichium pennsylvanicum 4]SNX85135.1 related to swi/snf-related matrix-associated actin-dependent regulator of chromatin, subfamily c, member 1 [Melanopsichium pennsylvanicum]
MSTLNLTGHPDPKLRTDPLLLQALASYIEPIKSALAADTIPSKSGSFSATDLADLVYELQAFQEDSLGVNAPRPAHPSASTPQARHPVRIPAELFLPTASHQTTSLVAPGSSHLRLLLQEALAFLASKRKTTWNLSDPTQKADNVQLIAHLRQALTQAGALEHPTVAVSPSITEAEAASLKHMAEQLECKWSDDPSDATHVLHPSDATPPSSPKDGDASSTSASEEYFRTIASRSGRALIHVWYRPDSYDTWLPAADFADPDPAPEKRLPWKIGAKWLRDSVRFNELMNPEDYEQEDALEATAAATEGEPAAASLTDAKKGKKRGLPDEITDASSAAAAAEAGGKRIKLLVAARPVGAVPIDLSGAQPIPGKKYENEPMPSGVLGNLPAVSAAPTKTEGDQPAVRAANDGDATMADGTTAEKPKDASVEEPTAEQAADPNAPVVQPDAAAIEQQRIRAEEIAKKYLASQTQEVIIPSYSTWFDMSTINAIEKRSLPEFFNNKNRSKTPTIYKDYRDFMINTYRLNPSEYLTFTACRRNLAGDVCAIMRVHAFLEQWGLINYQIDPETRPATMGPPFTGHFRVLVDTPRGLQPLHPGVRVNFANSSAAAAAPAGVEATAAASAVAQGAAGPAADMNLELRKTIFQTTLKGSRPVELAEANSLAAAADAELSSSGAASAPRYTCDTCGSDCTRIRYHSIKAKNYSLCPSCYLEGRFPSSMYSGDFVRLEDTPLKHSGGVTGSSSSGGDDWTDAETLRLLEGLEMFDDDWSAVSQHVETRSREQCITKFIQLPIEDGFLDGASQADLGPLQYARRDKQTGKPIVPFAQADNPVMSVVAFLASAVNPGVAAAAAQSALGELTENLRKRQNKANATGAGAGEEGKENGAAATTADRQGDDTAMEVDGDATKDSNDVDGGVTIVSDVKNNSSTTAGGASGVPRNAIERAAAIALGAAAAKAHVLSSFEEREIQRLVGSVVEAQLKKLELKMSQFEELESLLEAERRSVEAGRRQLYADRLAVQRQLALVNELLQKAANAPEKVGREDIVKASSAANGLPQQGPVIRAAEMTEGQQQGQGMGQGLGQGEFAQIG